MECQTKCFASCQCSGLFGKISRLSLFKSLRNLQKWPTSKNIYLSGAWRSHLFICCIHKLDTDNYKETQIHIYNSNAKRWFTPFSPFNGMISLACDVINDENGPLTFCSYTFKTTETRSHVEPLAFLEAFYRLPTG